MKLLLPMLAAGLLCGGCYVGKPVEVDPEALKWDEILTVTDVIERYNENTGALPSLWSRGLMDATLRETLEGDTTTIASADVFIQHLKPSSVRLKVKKVGLPGDLLDLGTNGIDLWLLDGYNDTLFIGKDDFLDPDKLEGLPIRPDLILQVLGVNNLSRDLLADPMPTLRFNPDSGGWYVLEFHEPARRGESRLITAKEVWLDSKELLPRKVVLFDEAGRPVLRANLTAFAEVGGEADAPPAKVATRYNLLFPETQSKMDIALEAPRLKYRGIPTERTFDPDFGRLNLQQIVNLNDVAADPR